MTDCSVPKLTKWPFLLGDVLLLGLATCIVWRVEGPLSVWPMLICLLAVAVGAWMCMFPFLREYEARLKLAEGDALTTAVAQIQNLESIKSRIVDATSHWQSLQESAGKTMQSAREISERM